MTMMQPNDGDKDDTNNPQTTTPNNNPTHNTDTQSIQITTSPKAKRRNYNKNSDLTRYSTRKKYPTTMTKRSTDGQPPTTTQTLTPVPTPTRTSARQQERKRKQGHSQQKDMTSKTEARKLKKSKQTMEIDLPDKPPPEDEEPPPDKEGEFMFDNDAPIKTDPNWKTQSLKSVIDPDDIKVATTPFTNFSPDTPEEGLNALNDASIIIGKLRYSTAEILDVAQVAQCTNPGHTLNDWTQTAIRVGTNDFENTTLNDADIRALRIFFFRMAHTKPSTAMPDIKRSKGAPTNISRAWAGALYVLGSWYATDEHGKKPTAKQTKLKAGFERQQAAADKTKQTNPDSNATTGKPPAQETANNNNAAKKTGFAAAPSGPSAKSAREARKNVVRINLAVKVHAENDLSSSTKFFSIIKDWFRRLRQNDASTVILTWLDADEKDNPAIDDPELAPTKISEFKPYCDKVNIRNKSMVWIKMRLGCNERPDDLTSNQNSNNQDWYTDNDCKGYFCTVQTSGDTVSVGDFPYSAAWMDATRLTHNIDVMATQATKIKFHFGCRIRKQSEVLMTKGKFVDFTMLENQVINIEVDRAQAVQFKRVLYHLFNRRGLTNQQRPGGYNIRLLPAMTMFTSGTKDNSARVDTWKKHTRVVQSLRLIRSSEIKALDDIITISTNRYTLREYLNSLTFPLCPLDDNPTPPLFHNVDYATQGRDKQQGIIYLVTTAEAHQVAEQVTAILPCLVARDINNLAATTWFHEGARELINEVTFNEDISGNWDGTWTTPDDEHTSDFLAEDMGIDIQFDEDLLKVLNKTQPSVNPDALSLKSFGDALGRKPLGDDEASDTQDTASVSRPAEPSAAPAPAEGGPAK